MFECLSAPSAFSGFGTGLSGGFGATSAAPAFSFNTSSAFGAQTTQAGAAFGGFGSSMPQIVKILF